MKFSLLTSKTWKGSGRTLDIVLTTAGFAAAALDVASGGASGGLFLAGVFAVGKLAKNWCDERSEIAKVGERQRQVIISPASEASDSTSSAVATPLPEVRESTLLALTADLRLLRLSFELLAHVALLVALSYVIRAIVDEIFRFLGPGPVLPKVVVIAVSAIVAFFWQFASPTASAPRVSGNSASSSAERTEGIARRPILDTQIIAKAPGTSR